MMIDFQDLHSGWVVGPRGRRVRGEEERIGELEGRVPFMHDTRNRRL